MTTELKIILLACLSLTCWTTAQAEQEQITGDTLQIPIGQQAKEKHGMKRPSKGMSISQVEAMYGQPIERRAARGTPPISSWIYQDFVVYFESDHVIHSVLKHRKKTAVINEESSLQ